MRSDIQRWNDKYRRRSPEEAAPDSLLIDHARLLPGDGVALDIACGAGQNAIFLAERGYQVIGLDGSRIGLQLCRANALRTGARVQLAALDLDEFEPPQSRFDLIVVFYYLNRRLLRLLPAALRPGGLLICRTFNTRRLSQHPGFRREYLLEDGELATAFAALETISSNDGATREDTTHWIGYRSSRPEPGSG
ncbi:MAG: methyltransferase domain-containing protein [Gammaproteobacteria bacterium]|jgi:SAM-dependent methyltransferase|nr:methyltransferase domain-containing protein [Gammaproteobacteria bacterium]